MALSGYGVYAEVTFAASAVDEAIPFLTVYLSDLPTAWHDAMANAGDTDGRTIRVTKSDGSTECAVYVPPGSVDTGADTGALFFRATDLSAVLDTTYMIWVGNAASTMYLSTDTYGRNAAFAGYAGAYLPGMTTDDLTGAGRDLTAVNSPGTAASLEGITAATYNGTSSYHSYSGTPGITAPPHTLESLFYATNTTTNGTIFSITNNTTNSDRTYLLLYGSGGSGDRIAMTAQGGGGAESLAETSSSFSATTWTYTAGTRSGTGTTGTSTAYISGANSGTNSTTTSAITGLNRTSIGARILTTTGVYFDGRIAVALLSDSVRSADYVSTMQDNWAGALYTASAVMYVTGTTGKLKLQSAATTSASGTRPDWADASNALTISTDVATVTVDDVTFTDSEFLEITNIAYNFAVPSGKSAYAATFYVTRRREVGGSLEINDLSFRFINESGVYSGTDMADLAAVWGATAGTKSYPVAGVTLSDGSFDANTGIAIQVTGFDSTGSVEARVEFVCVEITWDEGAPATDYGNFFEAYSAFGNVA